MKGKMMERSLDPVNLYQTGALDDGGHYIEVVLTPGRDGLTLGLEEYFIEGYEMKSYTERNAAIVVHSYDVRRRKDQPLGTKRVFIAGHAQGEWKLCHTLLFLYSREVCKWLDLFIEKNDVVGLFAALGMKIPPCISTESVPSSGRRTPGPRTATGIPAH